MSIFLVAAECTWEVFIHNVADSSNMIQQLQGTQTELTTLIVPGTRTVLSNLHSTLNFSFHFEFSFFEQPWTIPYA